MYDVIKCKLNKANISSILTSVFNLLVEMNEEIEAENSTFSLFRTNIE